MDRSELLKKVKEEVNQIYYEDGLLDLYKVAQSQNIKLFETDFKDDGISGVLAKESDIWQIYVNKNHHINRQRFTIAHELGHYFAYKYGSQAIRNYFDTNSIITDHWVVYRQIRKSLTIEEKEIETEANMIAAEILMPQEAIKNLVEKKVDIEDMAKTFGVSDAAISYRLKNLGYEPLELFYVPF